MNYKTIRKVIESYSYFTEEEKKLLFIKLYWIEKYQDIMHRLITHHKITVKVFRKFTNHIIKSYKEEWEKAGIPRKMQNAFQKIHMKNADFFIEIVELHIRNGTLNLQIFDTMLDWVMFKSIENFMYLIITKGV